jgi:hypothetical protein
LSYLLEANFYLVMFFIFYRLVLQNLTFYSLNRSYLLLTTIFSFILPLFKLGNWHSSFRTGDINLLNFPDTPGRLHSEDTGFLLLRLGIVIYVIISTVLFIRFCKKLFYVLQLIRKSNYTRQDGYRKVELYHDGISFSFFNFLFVNSASPQFDTIVQHELTHIKQWHSADILFFEWVRIFNWFNPVIPFLQRSVKMLHEFIADEHASKNEQSVEAYALFLVRNSSPVNKMALTSPMFNKSLLKKRIVMLYRCRSGAVEKTKYLAVFVLAPLLLFMTTFSCSKTDSINLIPNKYEMYEEQGVLHIIHVEPVKLENIVVPTLPTSSPKSTKSGKQSVLPIHIIGVRDVKLGNKNIKLYTLSAAPAPKSTSRAVELRLDTVRVK